MNKKYSVILLVLCLVSVFSLDARKKPKAFTHETVAIPAVAPRVVAVETAHTQLVLQVDEKGTVRTLHYGALVPSPEQFLDYRQGGNHNFGAPTAYPTAGGTFNGIDALHVKSPGGYQNTELYYVSHDTVSRGGMVSTTIHMKDYVTALEVDLVYDACVAEDVIKMHSVIRNAGKKAVELRNYASSSLNLSADDYLLTHFYGGWATEMQLDRVLLTHDTKAAAVRRPPRTAIPLSCSPWAGISAKPRERLWPAPWHGAETGASALR